MLFQLDYCFVLDSLDGNTNNVVVNAKKLECESRQFITKEGLEV